MPAERIAVKQNFLDAAPKVGHGPGTYALFVGRLSEEKGIRTLRDAWERDAALPLVVAGDGPLSSHDWPTKVSAIGHQPRGEDRRADAQCGGADFSIHLV